MAEIRPQIHILVLLVLPLLACAPALAEEGGEPARSLGLVSDEASAVSRFPRPASHIAENVTVVTAEEITRLNAHTLADVLQTVPGIQIGFLQTPGGIVLYELLGSTNRHILVQIDGVPQNFVSAENLAHIGTIPAQMLERVEVIKGASSAAWGSALGGIINVVTKNPSPDSAASLFSASTGSKGTSDLRAEATGTVNRLGYYLTGGTIRSGGLTPGNDVELSHGFGKLSYDGANGSRVVLGANARSDRAGIAETSSYNFREDGTIRYYDSYLTVQYPLAARLLMEGSVRGGSRKEQDQRTLLAQQSLFYDATARETYQGGAAALSWGDSRDSLKAGVEYERIEIRQRETVQRAPDSNTDLTLERQSFYLNGSYTLGRLSLLPGLRLDQVNLVEDPVSYTMGATYRVSDGTLLRAYAAHGYSMPQITLMGSSNGVVQRELQQVRTVQAGAETTALPHLWLKGMLFYNDIWNIQSYDNRTRLIRMAEQTRQGADLELRTSPVGGFALTGAYTFTDTRDRHSNEVVSGTGSGPRHAAKGGVNYLNPGMGLDLMLTGNYVNWRLAAPGSKGTATFWDLFATKKLFPGQECSPELFFSLRNIFDAKLYEYDFHGAAPRWFEAGGRVRF